MKFSIIICTCNSAQRLPKTLDSILIQDFADYEVVVVDGKSNDGTVDVIKKYEERFSGKLRWTSEKDNGIYEAMNKGVAMASGEFVNFIGAGDWLEKDALKNVFKTLEENSEANAVYGKTRIQAGKEKVIRTPVEDLPFQPMQHPAIFYKKALHEKFGNYNEAYKIAADYDFCIKTFLKGKSKVFYLDNVVVNFVMDGISSNKKLLCLRETLKARKENNLNAHSFNEIFNYVKNIRK